MKISYVARHCIYFIITIASVSLSMATLIKRKDDDEGASLSLTICGIKNLTRVLVSGYFRVAPT